MSKGRFFRNVLSLGVKASQAMTSKTTDDLPSISNQTKRYFSADDSFRGIHNKSKLSDPKNLTLNAEEVTNLKVTTTMALSEIWRSEASNEGLKNLDGYFARCKRTRTGEIDWGEATNMGVVVRSDGREFRKAAHDVYDLVHQNGTRSVAKIMNHAYIGEGAEKKTYSPKEARRQAVLEVLAMKLGNVFAPGQFSPSEVAVAAINGVETYAVVAPFVTGAFSVKDVREEQGLSHCDRDGVFFLAPVTNDRGRPEIVTQFNVDVREHLRVSERMRKGNNKINNHAIVTGRVFLNMSMYILGDIDEVHNRDNNVFLKFLKFHPNKDNTIFTPELAPFVIDSGLCFRKETNREDIADKARKLAMREDNSNRMGLELELNGHLATNVKSCKENFLRNLVRIYNEGEIEDLLDWATPFLKDNDNQRNVQDDLESLDHMRARLDICYLAGKCIEAGLNVPGKEQEAKEFIAAELANINQRREQEKLKKAGAGKPASNSR